MKTKILTLFAMVLFLISFVSAAEYYVATTGNNSNYGTLAQPWATLTYAESQLSTGDTVIVRGGTYNENFNIDVASVTFQNYPNESPVIDGNEELPGDTWGALVKITANGVTFDGFEVRESTGLGISIEAADNVTLKNCNAHDTYRHALRLKTGSDNALIEDCVFHHGVKMAYYGAPTPHPSTVGVKESKNSIFRRCKIYDSYSEGFSTYESAEGAVIEYCKIYGNKKFQLYINCCKNITARYNLIYGTSNGRGDAGIWLNSEAYCYNTNYAGGHKVYGNLVANTPRNFWIAGNSGRPVNNVIAYNNIFVEAYDPSATAYGVVVHSGGTGHVFKNNIVWQTNDIIADVPFSNFVGDYNLWSSTPDVDAQGANDPTYANPLLQKTTGWRSMAGGDLTGNDFTLQDSSPAINVGVDLGSPYNLGLDPTSTWPNNVKTLNQNNFGNWEIGGFVFTGGTCTESWTCTAWSAWSECIEDQQSRTRICTDLNNCGTIINKPAETDVQACGDLSVGLAGYWTMDNADISGGIIFDKSGNNNDGTIQGAVSTSGQINEALLFDGVDDLITVADDSSLDGFTSGFTISTWVKYNSINSDYIISKYDSTGNQRAWILKQQNSSDFRIYVCDDGVSAKISSFSFSPQTNTWYHLAGVWESNQDPVLYVDGETKSAISYGNKISSIYDSTSVLRIGNSYLGTNHINGAIDEVRIYNYALTSEEILTLYNAAQSSCGAADTNTDGAVDILEIMAHITAWKAGSVTIENLMIGIGEWKNGC